MRNLVKSQLPVYVRAVAVKIGNAYTDIIPRNVFLGVEFAKIECNCFNFCSGIVEEVYGWSGFVGVRGSRVFVAFIKMNKCDVLGGVFQQRFIFGVVGIDFWKENVVMVTIRNKRRFFPSRIKKIMLVQKSFVAIIEQQKIIIFIILLRYVLLGRFKMRFPDRKRRQQGRKPV